MIGLIPIIFFIYGIVVFIASFAFFHAPVPFIIPFVATSTAGLGTVWLYYPHKNNSQRKKKLVAAIIMGIISSFFTAIGYYDGILIVRIYLSNSI